MNITQKPAQKLKSWIVENWPQFPQKPYLLIDCLSRPSQLPMHKSAYYMWKGYRPYMVQHYDLERFDLDDFMKCSKRNNFGWDADQDDYDRLTDKRWFHRFMSKNTDLNLVERYSLEESLDIIQDGGRVLVKPVDDYLGTGVEVVDSMERLKERYDANNDLLMEEFLEPSDWVPTYGDAISTTRILVGRPDTDSEWEHLASVQKLPTEESYPCDNWGAGGICCGIDPDTHEIESGASKAYSEPVEWYSTHPDTDERVTGIKVPRFNLIVDDLLEASENFETLKIIGWDVLIYEDDYKILEGNVKPDIHMMQIHRPVGEIYND